MCFEWIILSNLASLKPDPQQMINMYIYGWTTEALSKLANSMSQSLGVLTEILWVASGQAGNDWHLGGRDTAFKIYLLTLNNNCTCVGWMIGHYERIDVYIELLSCSLGLTIDVWRWWRAGDGPSMSHSAKWDEGCQGWAMYRAGVTPCKEVSDLIFVIIINNPLSPHV